MNLMACDTGPLNYLIQIDLVDLLPRLCDTILIPDAVQAELCAAAAPSKVRAWAGELPSWCRIGSPSRRPSLKFQGLSEADFDVLSLAAENDAVVLFDDLAARRAARVMKLPLIGTLGLLELGSARRMVTLPDAISRLRATNARISGELYDEVLRRNGYPQ